MADGHSRALDFGQELVVDLFAGGGGASLGISRAYRHPDVAVNHSPVAIAVHTANHPDTEHHTCDVFEVDPLAATRGRPVGVLWASPDCRHHSKAKGGKPRSKKVRALAWVVVKWAAACRPRIICLENVEEFADWGPLRADGTPCPDRKGMTFRRWVRQLERLGYRVEHRELVAADYGAPTIRKRLYLVARCDGRPIVWPKPSHHKAGAGGLPRWRPAAECIDWTLPARSIFDRPRPLAANTLRRIAKGLWRYVLATAEPFIVGVGGRMGQSPERPVSGPFQTITTKADSCIAVPTLAPFLTEHANASTQRVFPVDESLRTQVAQVKGGHFALVSAFLEQANGGFYDGDGRSLADPVSTVCTAGANQRLVTAYLVKYYGNEREGISLAEPAHTVTTKDRLGLVQVAHVPADSIAPELRARARQCAELLHTYLPEHFPEPAELVLVGDYVLADITLRMLAPRELARAQGFPDTYVIERGPCGQPITKTDQVRLIGNSVCPDVAEALIRANAADLIGLYRRIAA